MSNLFSAVLIATSAIVFLMLQRSRYTARTRLIVNSINNKQSTSEHICTEPIDGFRGFVIEPCTDCCQASLELRKVTFSYRDRITLPLPGCDKKRCSCEIVETGDRRKWHRRSKMDRRNVIRFEPDSDDRRKKSSRREQDQIWSGGYIN